MSHRTDPIACFDRLYHIKIKTAESECFIQVIELALIDALLVRIKSFENIPTDVYQSHFEFTS